MCLMENLTGDLTEDLTGELTGYEHARARLAERRGGDSGVGLRVHLVWRANRPVNKDGIEEIRNKVETFKEGRRHCFTDTHIHYSAIQSHQNHR